MFKLGMIGTGIISSSYFNVLNEFSEFKLVAITEINEEKAKEVSKEQGVPYYLDYKEMCDREEIDAVVINLPHFLHCEVSVYCLEKGIHVLCEKPMANTADECQRMLDASEKTGSKLAIGHIMRFFPAIQVVKEYVENKKLGTLTMVNEVRNEPYFLPRRPRWFLKKELSGGGIVMNFGAHALDKLSYIVGEEFNNINSVCGNFSTDDDVEGHAQIFLTANGVPASITFSGYAPYRSNDTIFSFTNGALKVADGELFICDELYGEFRPFEYNGKVKDPFEYQLEEFAKLIRNEESICPDGEYGKNIISAIEEIYKKGF